MEAQRLFRRNVTLSQRCCLGFCPSTPTSISPGYTANHFPIHVLPLGAVVPEEPGAHTQSKRCIGNFAPLGSWSQLASYSLWPGGQASLQLVTCWCTRTVMVEVTLGTSRFSPRMVEVMLKLH
ncbi:hypothetical protein Tco_0543060 [Tanacetum coccineum]